jgi:hypothetical protein
LNELATMAVKHFLTLLLATVIASVTAGIYPSDHWEYSSKLTTSNYASKIQDEIDAGKTVFVRWIASEG